MQTNTKRNHKEGDDLPLPPPAHFDAKEIAEAKPVEPLPRLRRARGFDRRAGLVPIIVVGSVVSAGFAMTFTNPGSKPANSENPAAPTQIATDWAESPVAAAADDIPSQGTRKKSLRRGKRGLGATMTLVEVDDDGKPKPRLVSVIP